MVTEAGFTHKLMTNPTKFNLTRLPLYALFVVEGLVLYSSLFIASALKSGSLSVDIEVLVSPASAFAVVMLLSLSSMGLYQFHQRFYFHEIFVRVIVGLVFGSLSLIVVGYAVPALEITADIGAIATFYSLTFLLMIRFILFSHNEIGMFRRNTLVYGSGKSARAISDLRRRADRRGFRIVANVPAPGDTIKDVDKVILKKKKTLLELATEVRADEIVVAMDDRRGNLPEKELLECKLRGIDVLDLIVFLERETGKIRVDLVKSGWLIFSPGFRIGRRRRIVKRLFDLLIGLIILLITWPFMLMIAIAIKCEEGWRAPIIYRQRRSGHHGILFSVLKFRSMRVDAESDGKSKWTAKGDDRITKVGSVIRKYRLDELPQLFNVLRGQMSLVGPRPERPEFVDQLVQAIPFYLERHTVKPGVTGWAQVRYSYAASEEDATEKLQYDLYYVKNHNLLLDLTIILQTIEVILWNKGAR